MLVIGDIISLIISHKQNPIQEQFVYLISSKIGYLKFKNFLKSKETRCWHSFFDNQHTAWFVEKLDSLIKEIISLIKPAIITILSQLQMTTITYNAIDRMLTQRNGKGEKITIEATKVKKKGQTIYMDLNDGTKLNKAFISVQSEKKDLIKIGTPYGEQPKYLIQIREFSTVDFNGMFVIQIRDFASLTPPKLKVQTASNQKKTIKRDMKYEQQNSLIVETQGKLKIQSSKKKDIQLQIPDDDEMQEEEQNIDDERLRNFEKIGDLYTDFQGKWEIVVRVLQKQYREFTNRSGKLTKIFSMILVDRTGTKIQGIIFGDKAQGYHEKIIVNAVYRMSRGQIKEQTFKKNRSDKFSKYNIIFNENSSFIRIKDISRIPRQSEEATSLEDVVQQMNFDSQYDIFGILLYIGEGKNFDKEDGRSFYKINIKIGDPQIRKSIDVTIWNKDLKIDSSWINKTVLLRKFKLNNYKEVLSLNSTFKSEIIPQAKHPFTKFQGKLVQEDYESLSGGSRSQMKDENRKDRSIKTIKELQNQIIYLGANETIVSDMEVWLTRIEFKGKWCYEACNNPKCKKSTESHSRCIHCGFTNNVAQKRFMIPVELSDSTGSIRITAFDDFALVIFKGVTIDDLSRLPENELPEEAEKRLFQQYRVKISTRKENEGNIKHNIVGQVNEVNINRVAASNIDKIIRTLYD